MTETAPTGAAPTAPATGDIVARPDRVYRIKWLVAGVVLLGYGWLSLYDGYVTYPRLNQAAIEDALRQGKPPPEKLPHGGYDIPFNKVIGWGFQPLGVLCIAWTCYRTRGAYRLSADGGMLHVPGHPPVPLDNIREIDPSTWQRKGVLTLTYEVPGAPGRTARLTLDDFRYEHEPTGAIYERIKSAVLPGEAEDAEDCTTTGTPTNTRVTAESDDGIAPLHH